MYFLLSLETNIMDEKFLKLTNTVYKVLEFFPESDPLKNRAKDKALVIMDSLVLINDNSGWASFQKEKVKVQLLEDIDSLLGYLWIAKAQGWLNSINYLIISGEYEKVKKDIKPIVIEFTQKLPFENNNPEPIHAPKSVVNSTEPKTPVFSLSSRQDKILDFIRKNSKAQVMDLRTVLPNVTKRTIRRDLDELLSSGKVTRMGEFNQVFYTIKS